MGKSSAGRFQRCAAYVRFAQQHRWPKVLQPKRLSPDFLIVKDQWLIVDLPALKREPGSS